MRRNEPKGGFLQAGITILSGLLLLSAATYLVWEGTHATAPPNFDWQLETVQERSGRFYLRATLTNDGGESVQNLSVSIRLQDGQRTVERSETVVDWLPQGSSRRVVFILNNDPELHRTTVEFGAYSVP